MGKQLKLLAVLLCSSMLSAFTIFTNVSASSIQNNNEASPLGQLVDTTTGEKLNVETTSTIRTISPASEGTPEIIEQTVTGTFELPKTRGSTNITDGDPSGSWTASLTITYAKYYDNENGTMYLLKTVTGSWEQQDIQVSISDKKVAYGCSSLRPLVNQTHYMNVIMSGFYSNTGFTQYISDNFMGSICGAGMSATLYRKSDPSHTWEFYMPNNIVNTGYVWDFGRMGE